MSPDGAVLDPSGILVYRHWGWHFSPRTVFDGTNHLITFYSMSSFPWDGDPSYHVLVSRVSPGGVALDPTPFDLQIEAGNTEPMAAVPRGADTLLLNDGYQGLQAARILPNNTLAAPPVDTLFVSDTTIT